MKKIDSGKYVIELCPNCLQESPYKPNPMYMYDCEKCGFEGRDEDVLMVYDDISFEEDIKKEREHMKNHGNITLLSKLKKEKK